MHSQIYRGSLIATLALLLSAGGAPLSTETSYADAKALGHFGWASGDRTDDQIEVKLYGTISKADANYFAQHVVEYEAEKLLVRLDSLGGDVDAAMLIGRIVRKNEGVVYISKGSQCYSSCALIYIAGVSRDNDGVIGLHRPYLASAPQSRQSVEREAPLMLQRLKSYVQEMGITDNFYQEMVNTEPSAIKLYAGDKIKNMVPSLDPTYDEVETAYRARRFGTSTAEMRMRDGDSITCHDPPSPTGVLTFDCMISALWGLSDSVYKRRSKTLDQCQLSDEEERALKLVKRKERRDHPLYLKREACVRNIMLGR
jgi:hypothetical protein